MNSKLRSLSEFIKSHPFITVGTILIIDGWVTSILNIIKEKNQKKKADEAIEVEFNEVKEEETNE